MGTQLPIGTAADVCAHALAAETEAMSRCSEFADYLEARGDEETAQLFRTLAQEDSRHSVVLAERMSANGPAPVPFWAHSWLDDGPAMPGSHGFVYHLMTPYHALNIALTAERRTRRFFEQVASQCADPEARAVAAEMVREEDAHIGALEQALQKAPRPLVSEADYEQILIRR
ncbi:MAG: ferritin-like domain-containing protein [Pseudomonadota bacterium]